MGLNFPSSPSDGQEFSEYVWNAATSAWRRKDQIGYSLPAGSILAWGGAVAPSNWGFCDGSAISRTANGALFNAIGTTFGVGDGSTTFNVPNLNTRPEFYVQASVAQSIGASSVTQLSSAWGAAPTVNNGFTSWTGGTLTIATAGWYTITFHGALSGGSATGIITASGRQYFQDSGNTSTTVTTTRYMAAGDTISASLFVTSSQTVSTSRTDLSVVKIDYAQYSGIAPKYIIKYTSGTTPGDSELATRVSAVEARSLTPLYQVIPSSVVVGSGSASVAADGTVTATACSSVSLNDIFDGLGADDYLVIADGDGSTTSTITFRLRVSGADTSTASHVYVGVQASLSAGPSRSSSTTATSFGFLIPTAVGSSNVKGSMFLYGPGKSTSTFYKMDSFSAVAGDRYLWTEGGNTPSGVRTGLSLICSAGTYTGTIKVVKLA